MQLPEEASAEAGAAQQPAPTPEQALGTKPVSPAEQAPASTPLTPVSEQGHLRGPQPVEFDLDLDDVPAPSRYDPDDLEDPPAPPKKTSGFRLPSFLQVKPRTVANLPIVDESLSAGPSLPEQALDDPTPAEISESDLSLGEVDVVAPQLGAPEVEEPSGLGSSPAEPNLGAAELVTPINSALDFDLPAPEHLSFDPPPLDFDQLDAPVMAMLVVAAPPAQQPKRWWRSRSVPNSSAEPSAAPEQHVIAPLDPQSTVLPHEVVNEGRWWLRILGVAALVAVFAMRLINLDGLPGEMYGDIAIVYEYITSIVQGFWPISFELSAGPLYHYLVMPVIWITGRTYIGLKIASLVVSLGVLLATYGLARELLDRKLAILSVFVAGVSSWLLIYSRLGNSQILVPFLAMAALYFVVRTARHDQWWNAAAAGIISAAGLYVYPQSFVLAPVFFLTLLALRLTKVGVQWRDLAYFTGLALAASLPFAGIVARDPSNFFSGYIGGKLETDTNVVTTLLGNFWRSMLAFHVRGDAGFRGNPPNLPHLDLISGLFCLAGLVFWLQPQRRRWSPAIVIPFVLLQVPAMLVLANPDEIPSASRTLGMAPLAYLLTASGIWWLTSWLGRMRWAPQAATVVALALIVSLNSVRYFEAYATNLPERNTPFARIIADYLNTLPPETNAFIVGCCWGQAGQPEPKGIQYVNTQPVSMGIIELQKSSFSCASMDQLPKPTVLIWDPSNELPVPELSACANRLQPLLHTSPSGLKVFYSSMVGQ